MQFDATTGANTYGKPTWVFMPQFLLIRLAMLMMSMKNSPFAPFGGQAGSSWAMCRSPENTSGERKAFLGAIWPAYLIRPYWCRKVLNAATGNAAPYFTSGSLFAVTLPLPSVFGT